MAQEAIVTIKYWDDIEAAAGRKVEADGTHILKLDGMEVELDLTDNHYGVLLETLKLYFEVGHKVTKTKKKPAAPTAPVRERRPREFYLGLRAFADERGIRYVYGGKASFSDALIRQYEAFLLAQEQSNESVGIK
jgi:hypothetical protein